MSSINYEEENLDEFNVDDLDIDDSDLNKNSKDQPSPKKGPSGPKKTAGPKGKINKKKSQEPDKKTTYSILIGGFIVIAISMFLIFNSISSKKQARLEAQLKEQQEQLEQSQNTNNGEVSTGIPNLYGTGKTENNSPVTSSDKILKDLNGNTVAVNYNVMSSETVTDFVSYTKHRAITGDGIEFYWLEAVYKKQPCKVQVPYSIYSKLDDEGITVVDAEVLTLDNGSEIVTYMSVRKDAKDLLDKNR